MARLLNWPSGFGIRAWQPLSGPRAVGSASSTSIGGFTQGVASAFGGWAYAFTFPVCKDRAARRLRGWVTGMHGGANATRVPFYDADGMTFAEAGVSYSDSILRFGNPWANGQAWENGENWAASLPTVSVAADAAKGATIVTLADSFWGYGLGDGDFVGFYPLHFGKYTITEVIAPGTYRIWPPLRKAITTATRATLNPTLAMRMTGEDAASLSRGLSHMEETTITLFEVFDDDVRDYFAD